MAEILIAGKDILLHLILLPSFLYVQDVSSNISDLQINYFKQKHLSRSLNHKHLLLCQCGLQFFFFDKSIVYTALSWNLTLNCVENDKIYSFI